MAVFVPVAPALACNPSAAPVEVRVVIAPPKERFCILNVDNEVPEKTSPESDPTAAPNIPTNVVFAFVVVILGAVTTVLDALTCPEVALIGEAISAFAYASTTPEALADVNCHEYVAGSLAVATL